MSIEIEIHVDFHNYFLIIDQFQCLLRFDKELFFETLNFNFLIFLKISEFIIMTNFTASEDLIEQFGGRLKIHFPVFYNNLQL